MKNIFNLAWIIVVLGCGFLSCKGDNSIKTEKTSISVDNDSGDQVKNSNESIEESIKKEPVIDVQNKPGEDKNQEEVKILAIDNKPQAILQEKSKSQKMGVITFEEKVHYFGKIPQGEVVSKKFKFTNTGDAPLNIKSVGVTCGCTAPSYPFLPIGPGEESHITVEFRSVGKMGSQNQTATVNTDGTPSSVLLRLSGIVVPKGDADPSSD
ncbi:MAG: DUF1573 domain-containing protein [Saprospiraceae bacterium]|nr:DUF1573 domain-containing protein [Saprospiraceae bacterium]